MAKLESNLKNMVLSLTLITLFAAAALGGVYVLTEEPIALAKQQKQTQAIAKVLPEYATLEDVEEHDGLIFHRALDQDGQLAGTAIETSENGFGGVFRLMVGFDKEGNIVNYEVLEQQETPGLGTHMVEWFKTEKNNQSIIGKNPAEMKFYVSKDGGDVDAITAATISSRAFLKAVEKAHEAITTTQVEALSAAIQLQDSIQTINNENTKGNE